MNMKCFYLSRIVTSDSLHNAQIQDVSHYPSVRFFNDTRLTYICINQLPVLVVQQIERRAFRQKTAVPTGTTAQRLIINTQFCSRR